MTEMNHYAEGDWIVHFHYGIGRIDGFDVKDISGEEKRYCRIQATDSTFWVPIDQMDGKLVRPLATSGEIEQAIAALQRPPKTMSSNYKVRQQRIKTARERNTPRSIARVIRDLRALRRKQGALNQTERGAFRTFQQQLVEEWALVTGNQTDMVATKLENLLNPTDATVVRYRKNHPGDSSTDSIEVIS